MQHNTATHDMLYRMTQNLRNILYFPSTTTTSRGPSDIFFFWTDLINAQQFVPTGSWTPHQPKQFRDEWGSNAAKKSWLEFLYKSVVTYWKSNSFTYVYLAHLRLEAPDSWLLYNMETLSGYVRVIHRS